MALSVAQREPCAQALPGNLSVEPGLSSRRPELFARGLSRDRPVGDATEVEREIYSAQTADAI